MAVRPFSPFRSAADLDTDREPTALDRLWLGGFAALYRALGAVMSPAEADECELWQLAAVLGVDESPTEEDPLDGLAARIAAEKEQLAERARALPGSIPAPVETDRPGLLDVTEQMKREMGLPL